MVRSREGRSLLLLYAGTRLAFTLIGVLARLMFPDLPRAFNPPPMLESYSDLVFLDVWGCWDSTHYLPIAQEGYAPEPLRLNFFPLYPLLARLGSFVLVDTFLSGLVVSDLALLGSMYYLYRYTRLSSDKETSVNAVRYMLLFPTSFVFNGFFSESIALVLVLAAMYHARTRKYWISGIALFLASLAKSMGVLTVIPVFLEYLRQRDYDPRRLAPDVLWLALGPAGAGLYMLYNYHLTGDLFYFATAQHVYWGFNINVFTSIIAACFCIPFLLAMFKKWLDLPDGVLSCLFIATPIVGGILASIPRYLLMIFPLYISMARVFVGKHQGKFFLWQCVLMFTWALRAPVVI